MMERVGWKFQKASASRSESGISAGMAAKMPGSQGKTPVFLEGGTCKSSIQGVWVRPPCFFIFIWGDSRVPTMLNGVFDWPVDRCLLIEKNLETKNPMQ